MLLISFEQWVNECIQNLMYVSVYFLRLSVFIFTSFYPGMLPLRTFSNWPLFWPWDLLALASNAVVSGAAGNHDSASVLSELTDTHYYSSL